MRVAFTHLDNDQQGRRETFASLPVRIGRSSSNDLILTGDNTRASSRHAEVFAQGSAVLIKDLSSTNGTFVNGLRITQAQINNGDVLEFGLGGPKLSFEQQLTAPGISVNRPRLETESVNTPVSMSPREMPLAVNNLSGKEFGRETVQFMLNQALHRSAIGWKLALAGTCLLVVVVSAIFVYQLVKRETPLKTKPAPAQTVSFTEIAADNQRAIVLIYNRFELYGKNGEFLQEQVSTGTGFIINNRGDIITNHHVIEPWLFKSINNTKKGALVGKTKELGVFFANDPLDAAHMHAIKSSRFSKEVDVALLSIGPLPDLQVVTELNENVQTLQQGEEIAVLAFPLGLELNELTQDKTAKSSLMRGVISKIPDNKKQIQLDITAYEGSSGGPIFNSSGEVIGLLTSGPNDTLNFGTPIQYAINLLKQKP